MRPIFGLLLATSIVVSSTMAYESAFPATEAGTSEIKTLPAGTLLKSASGGDYFENGNSLFRPLFRYISTHGIAMTVPVEATVDDAAMYFWVAQGEISKVTGDENGVEVIDIPERLVASRGARGGYSRDNFERIREELTAWVAAREDVRITGDAYVVYWNGPFTPWFVKRFEVHLPIERVAASNDGPHR
ncbi:MAG: heme-binding protein [Opitutaceae bacterium]